MAVEPFYSTYLQTGIGGAQNWDLSCCHVLGQCADQENALPTEQCWLNFSNGGSFQNFTMTVIDNSPCDEFHSIKRVRQPLINF